MPFTAGQKLRASQMPGIIARARRTTPSTAFPVLGGVLRLDSISVVGGLAYRVITSGLTLVSTVNGDTINPHVRFSTSGSATTASATLPGASVRLAMPTGATAPIVPLVGFYFPASNATLSVLLCVGRTAGTGNVSIFADAVDNAIDMIVEEDGFDPGNTGISI